MIHPKKTLKSSKNKIIFMKKKFQTTVVRDMNNFNLEISLIIIIKGNKRIFFKS